MAQGSRNEVGCSLSKTWGPRPGTAAASPFCCSWCCVWNCVWRRQDRRQPARAAELCGSQRGQATAVAVAASPPEPRATPLLQATERLLPLMLVGNKMDLRPGLPEAAGVHTALGQQLAMVSRYIPGPPGQQGPADTH